MSEKAVRMEKTSHTRGPTVKGGAVMDIVKFDEEIKMSKPGDSFESSIFLVGDKPFIICVYPNGSKEEHKGHVSVAVGYEGEDEVYIKSLEVTATVKEGIKKKKHALCPTTIDDYQAFFWGKWATHAACLASIKDNIFEVKAEVEMLGKRVVIGQDAEDINGDKSRYISDFKSLFGDTSLADFVIKCGGKVFKCHKVILSARSPVFRRMIASEMEEGRRGEATIKDVAAETFEKVLQFIYGDEVEDLGSQDQVEQLLYAADKYEIQELVRTS
jgi:hypothetical protein